MADDLFGDRLLMIDDEPGFGRLVKKIAQDAGFEVVVTEDADTFVKTARLWHPSVILLDLKMPGTDGVQLLRILAADKCAAHIVLTSGAEGKIVETAMQIGRERGLNIREALPKPIRVEMLRERLSEFKRMPKLQLSADLARALSTDQLFLEYQPRLDCRLARITGVEALVRWDHPVHGIIQPDQFIALAEEVGLISRLTDRVVSQAAMQAARWRTDNIALEIAVNISARDLEDLDLPDRLDQHCRNYQVDPAMMTIELTETGAMHEAVQMMDVLTRLRLKGFKLSIDDFGTGYSSLVQLQKMPFSEIKIDRSFVMQMQTNQGCRVVVEIVIDLARKLGLISVAEGVEEEAALHSLREMGCDAAQGFHVCRPLAAVRVADFVRGYEPRQGRGTAAA
jgi:EAL domain-containing protein (putative c-di-GMP-specific phosphodiesterase class I)